MFVLVSLVLHATEDRGNLLRKNLLACLVGPLAIIPASLIYRASFAFLDSSLHLLDFEGILIFAFGGLVVAYTITFILGLPIALLLHKYQKLNFVNISLVPVMLSVILAVSIQEEIWDFLFVMYFGLFVSTACWLLYRSR